MFCPTCKSPVPEHYIPEMQCAMCLRFGADRNNTHGEENITTWRNQAEAERTESREAVMA